MQGLRARLRAGQRLVGTMLTLPSPAVAEILASCGFDWLFVDGEHSPFGIRDLEAVLQAVGHRVACLVRVPALDEAAIKRVLDLGAAGIIVPQVNSAEEAARVVRFSRYSPVGARGVGLARAHGYGMQFSEYLRTANDEIVVVVQAEHIEAVRNIESIVRVEGIDAVLVGPYDLSASLGKLGRIEDPEVRSAIERVSAAGRQAGMRLGIFAATPPEILPYVQQGYTLLVVGVDALLLGRAAQALRAELGQ